MEDAAHWCFISCVPLYPHTPPLHISRPPSSLTPRPHVLVLISMYRDLILRARDQVILKSDNSMKLAIFTKSIDLPLPEQLLD